MLHSIPRAARPQCRAASIWACNLGLLLAARLGNGFRFARVAGVLAPLDAHRGVVRWEICFNLSVLRMLSYSLDLHWRRLHLASGVHCRQVGQSPSAPRAGVARWRQQAALPGDADYGLLPCLAYVLYVPLYLAGPIITFQDFAWQLRRGVPASVRAVRCGPRVVARANSWLEGSIRLLCIVAQPANLAMEGAEAHHTCPLQRWHGSCTANSCLTCIRPADCAVRSTLCG